MNVCSAVMQLTQVQCIAYLQCNDTVHIFENLQYLQCIFAMYICSVYLQCSAKVGNFPLVETNGGLGGPAVAQLAC